MASSDSNREEKEGAASSKPAPEEGEGAADEHQPSLLVDHDIEDSLGPSQAKRPKMTINDFFGKVGETVGSVAKAVVSKFADVRDTHSAKFVASCAVGHNSASSSSASSSRLAYQSTNGATMLYYGDNDDSFGPSPAKRPKTTTSDFFSTDVFGPESDGAPPTDPGRGSESPERNTSRNFSKKRKARPSTGCEALPEACTSILLACDVETDNEIDVEPSKSEDMPIKEEEYACETEKESG